MSSVVDNFVLAIVEMLLYRKSTNTGIQNEIVPYVPYVTHKNHEIYDVSQFLLPGHVSIEVVVASQ
jgi:hypothetical protein